MVEKLGAAMGPDDVLMVHDVDRDRATQVQTDISAKGVTVQVANSAREVAAHTVSGAGASPVFPRPPRPAP